MTEMIEPEKVPVQEPPSQPIAPEKKTPPRQPDPVKPGRG